MKYKDFEGSVQELVRLKLREVEEKEHVKVLHAVESGSRAWGFPSPDSDYDVRFIYVRQWTDYLKLQERKDYIDWELDETLDMNGWDLSKALRHFHKSNAMLFEWAGSPIVYDTTTEWELIRETAFHYFSRKSVMYHYYGTANKTFQEYLTGDKVKYKKYFYALRPILACKWIEKKSCPPPVLFRELADGMLEEDMRPIVEKLLREKQQMSESDEKERLDVINAYIADNLTYYKQKTNCMEDDRNPGWEELNTLFLRLLAMQKGWKQPDFSVVL